MFSRYFICITCFIILFISQDIYSQCLSKTEILKRVSAIENNQSFSAKQKLINYYALENIAASCLKDKDSVHAWIFLKIGKYEFLAHNDFERTAEFTKTALQTNNYTSKGASLYLNINAYYNLASAYESLLSYNKAITYYDSVLYLCRNITDTNAFVLDTRSSKANIYFSLGDYQKAAEESITGIHLAEIENNPDQQTSFMNMEAQSFLFQNNTSKALPIAYKAAVLAKQINNVFELATAYKTLALICEKNYKPDSAKYYYNAAINARLQTNMYSNIGADYNELGNFYNDQKDYVNAAVCYNKFLFYANKSTDTIDRSVKTAMAYLNFAENFFQQGKIAKSEVLYIKSMKTLKLNINNILECPSAKQIGFLNSNAKLVIALMSIKTKLLLSDYKTNKQNKFIQACLQTALVTDSVITQIRHEHIGEQSKLFWRDKTNQFYINAIEACYLSNNAALAFYFIEKSRAMLLGDKLNELNAASYLPKAETREEETYQIKIVELEQKLLLLKDTSSQYKDVQLQLLSVKDAFEHYTKSLEKNYPVYYQYKYADEVPALKMLQQYLAKSKQSFVHYFPGDSVYYILAVTATSTKFIQCSSKDFNKENLTAFIKLCADKNALNTDYTSFCKLSNNIYSLLFKPLDLPKGRVVICTGNEVIPFDALCIDDKGKHFLLTNYSFDYVYSARFLLKQFNNSVAKGDFVGYAPVSFANNLGVANLNNAEKALNASSTFYKNALLFTNENASRNNFFRNASDYSIVSIFSHARADTTDNEPVLFMHDSVIHLSELQLLNNPATKLVMLSACQTNVGKTANGEGIYSLARGFATAGIPSISATLWKADEEAIYSISEKFNQYLSEGMNKDEALQKAKLDYISSNKNSEKILPYYWANMILIGNTDAIKSGEQSTLNMKWMIAASIAVVLLIFIWKRKVNKQIKH